MLLKIIYLMAGGALGTFSRYVVSGFMHRWITGFFPWGTLAVNATGALFIGLSWGLFEIKGIPPHTRMFLFVGFLGGYTTFSTFALETMNLAREGAIKTAVFSMLANNVLAIAFVFGGYFLAKAILTYLK